MNYLFSKDLHNTMRMLNADADINTVFSKYIECGGFLFVLAAGGGINLLV